MYVSLLYVHYNVVYLCYVVSLFVYVCIITICTLKCGLSVLCGEYVFICMYHYYMYIIMWFICVMYESLCVYVCIITICTL